MSTGRLKDQADYDLEQIVGIIDTALESDDQRIKDALRALLTITVLCTAEHPDQAVRMGPLARVLEDLNNLNQRLGRIEREIDQRLSNMGRELGDLKQRMPPPAGPAPYNPPGVVGPWIGTPNTGNPWTGTNPNSPKPMWGPSYTSAGDDPNYTGASSGTKLAEDFIKELERK